MNPGRTPLKRKITAILAADLAEYTRLTAEDEEETLARLESYLLVFYDFVAKSGGRVFSSAGDGLMCEFASAVEATRCAIDIQESLRTRNMAFPANRQMHFRIGISIGDVVERDGDLLGDGVNVAARLQTLAEPGQICVSRNVQEAVANKISLPFVDLGERRVKNLPYAVHAFLIEVNGPVSRGSRNEQRRPRQAGHSWLRSWPAGALAGALLAVASGGAIWKFQSQQPESGSGSRPEAATTAAALYQSARQNEERGDGLAARRDYLALAALGADYVDPILRLAAVIRAQDGRPAAREVLAELSQRGGRATKLVHALQFEGSERFRRIEEFAAANPAYAPAHAVLAGELGEDRQNSQTIDEKRRELAAQSRFLAAEREGVLPQFFLDQSAMSAWVDRAQKREAALKAFLADNRTGISLQFTPNNAGWSAAISLPEAATAIEYRFGGDGAFRQTGTLQALDPRTGKPMPKPSLEFSRQQKPLAIELRYADANGVMSPVTSIAFEPKAALQQGMRGTLEQISTSWLSFGVGQNSSRAYFAVLMSYRCAIEKVEIGFDGEAPNRTVPLPVCDPSNPMNVPANAKTFIELNPAVASVAVRLTFVGGATSDVKTFTRAATR